MKRTQLGLVFVPLFLLGCAAHSPKPNQREVAAISTKAVITSKDAIKKIPRNLRPEALESRDDTSVVIRPGKARTYKEYRIGGQLYAIKVTPKVGRPYYLIAADNEGNPIDPAERTMLVPSWVIFEWK